MQFRDWYVCAFIAAAFAVATTYLFKFHSDTNYGLWCGFIGGFGVAFHIVMTYDQKRPDAP